jgi:hypothetical protein
MQECMTGTDYWASERHDRGYRGEAIYGIEHARGDAVELFKLVALMLLR